VRQHRTRAARSTPQPATPPSSASSRTSRRGLRGAEREGGRVDGTSAGREPGASTGPAGRGGRRATVRCADRSVGEEGQDRCSLRTRWRAYGVEVLLRGWFSHPTVKGARGQKSMSRTPVKVPPASCRERCACRGPGRAGPGGSCCWTRGPGSGARSRSDHRSWPTCCAASRPAPTRSSRRSPRRWSVPPARTRRWRPYAASATPRPSSAGRDGRAVSAPRRASS